MDASTIPVTLEVSTKGEGLCSLHTNSISYELKGLKEKVLHEAPALTVTTRAIRGYAPLDPVHLIFCNLVEDVVGRIWDE